MNATTQDLKDQVADLHAAVEVAGIPEHSLTGRMVQESIRTLNKAMINDDLKTFERCLHNTRMLLSQWNSGLCE